MEYWAYILKGLEIVGALLFMVFFGSFCVFIHELGHFLAAKWRGLHIVAFSLGFKKAWGKKINGVDYRIGWLPFGGYVDLPQIDTTGVPKTEDGKELPVAKPIDRMITAFAGPFFNILFGLALGVIVWWVGVPQDTPKMRSIVVDTIDKAGPEYQAGLRSNDRIVKINNERFFCTWNQFVQKILFSVGKVSFDVKRDGKNFQFKFVPKENPKAPKNLKREKLAWPYFTPRIPIVLYPETGSPAAKAGIKSGDILESVNGKKVSNYLEFSFLIDTSEGKPVSLVVSRDGKRITINNIIPVVDEELTARDKDNYRVGVEFALLKDVLKLKRVVPGSPAEAAGLKAGDVIVKADGKTLPDFIAFKRMIIESKGKPFSIEVKRDGKEFSTKLTARKEKHYVLGVQLTVIDHPTPWNQFVRVLDMSYKSLRGIIYGLAQKIGVSQEGSSLKPRNLSGPIGLGRTIFISVYQGSFMIGLYFVVMISFALAIFNLLPLPVLDGGHMLLAGIELVVRRPLHEQAVKALTFVFIVLLISLMVYVTYYDILRFLPFQEKAGNVQANPTQKVKVETKNGAKANVPAAPVKTDKAR
jgi:RIP metalloprotease RseP